MTPAGNGSAKDRAGGEKNTCARTERQYVPGLAWMLGSHPVSA